jgi:hypothetical protein
MANLKEMKALRTLSMSSAPMMSQDRWQALKAALPNVKIQVTSVE